MSVAPAAGQRQPVDDIFLDHPSMDSNATTAPAANARPVQSIFRDRAILDASVARTASGRWFLTGTPQRDGPKDGVRLWTSRDGKRWQSLGAVHAAGRRVLAPDVAIGGDQLFLTFQDQDGCARIATGLIAQPSGRYRESPCLVPDAADPSLFVDRDGGTYLLWAGGMIARLTPDLNALAEDPRFLKPDQAAFAKPLPAGQDWPVRVRIGEKGATMFRDGERYVVVASEITNRMRSPTEDVFMATAPTPYGPFTRRFLAVPHAGRTSIITGTDGRMSATYNPQCADRYAVLCEQVALVPLERTPDNRLRPVPSVLTEGGTVAALRPAEPIIGIRDPSVTRGPDGGYYLVGTTGRNRQAVGELALWQSSDLRRWSETRLTFDRADLGRTFRNSVALWAPELRWVEKDRTFYLAFSMMERDVGGKTWLYRSTTGRAEGPYRNVAPAHLVEGIDGFVFEDDAGVYLLWGGGWLGQLNARRDGFKRPPVRLVDTDGENVGYEGNGLARIGDRYVITGAEWNGPLRTHGTYDMMYGSARSIWGPYGKRQVGAAHAGHGTVFQDRGGGWWTTMFGNDVTAPFRKKLGFVPLHATEDGLSVRAGESGTQQTR
ncbi:family 43 glycosylhydrolase [Sphingomonas sp.]|uniref:family 43 glycosylhydrolase n=1 Tax=Sphingomonas sp. TaxID=28214 RepID=UPI002B5EF1A4|nr:family 43 glycosylhydrolase [Sphingomonas sp.]HTG37864.1 family 43 glycosylhydrolase [Sphingomonas sp.]